MARPKNPNLEILRLTVAQLGELADEFVFVGGCATGLLITDPAAPPIRVTRDVDAIVQVASRAEYYHLSKRLRARGFQEDTTAGAPLCRWRSDQLILDVMPTDLTQSMRKFLAQDRYTPRTAALPRRVLDFSILT